MQIVFCIDSLNKGGAERVVANLSNEFVKKNDVTIITTISTYSNYDLDKRINLYSLTNGKMNFTSKLTRIYKMYNLLKKIKPDIVITFLPPQSIRVLLVKKLLKVKVIVSVRNDPRVESKKLKFKLGMKLLYKRADGFVFQTADARDFFPDVIRNKSVIIPNPIGKDFICKPYNGKRNTTIVTVGRLEEQKNHKLLIKAFYEVNQKYSNYNLIIYGEGSLKDNLIKYIEELQIDDKVIFKGNVDNIKDEIYKSGIFVLSSDYEGMPNSLMEAMAIGLPCISTDCPCGGPNFLIKNGHNGLLVPVGNKDFLVEKIIYLIENSEIAKKLGNEANNICNTLNPEVINKKWLEYINKIANQ